VCTASRQGPPRQAVLAGLWALVAGIVLLHLFGRGVNAAEDSDRTRAACAGLLKELSKLPLWTEERQLLAKVFSLPSAYTPRQLQGQAVERVAQLKGVAVSDVEARLDGDWFRAKDASEGLVPLGEKVAGEDCFGSVIRTPVGPSHLRATYSQVFLVLIADRDALGRVPPGELAEFSQDEVKTLAEDDRARYEMAATVLTGCNCSVKGAYYQQPLALLREDVTSVKPEQKALKDRAMACLRVLLRDKALVRCKWRYRDVEAGLLPESILSFPGDVLTVRGKRGRRPCRGGNGMPGIAQALGRHLCFALLAAHSRGCL